MSSLDVCAETQLKRRGGLKTLQKEDSQEEETGHKDASQQGYNFHLRGAPEVGVARKGRMDHDGAGERGRLTSQR